MSNSNNPALEKYAKLMIEKISAVNENDWKKPWFTVQFKDFPQNLSGRRYSNLNKTMLYLLCDINNYQTPVFLTFKQAQKESIQIKSKSVSFPISYYDLNIKNLITGERVTKDFYNLLSVTAKKQYKVSPILKHFNVFNLDQTNFAEKYPDRWVTLKKQFAIDDFTNINDGYRNRFIDQTIENQTWICPINQKEQNRAFYSHSTDSITLPTIQQFPSGKEFYYTALHEMAHSTGHQERLARKFGNFGTVQYAHEELIAELSSAVAGRDLGLAVLPRKENAQYLKSWLVAITDDSKFLFGILQDVSKSVTMIEEGISLTKENEEIQSKPKEIAIPVMTEDEYLASKGYNSSFYSESAIHKQQDQLLSIHIGSSNKYLTEKNIIKEEYQRMLNNGEIRQPNRIERIIKAANGYPNLESTQAARRIAFAQGISWQPGKDNLPEICQYYYDQHQQLHAKFYEGKNICDRCIWENGNNYILCTGSRSGGDYVEHVLPPEEVLQIKKLCKEIELHSSGCKTLIGEGYQINNYRILDKSTGKTEVLTVGDIDLSKQPSESVKGLLSGKQVEITNKSGLSQMIGLSKTPAGWGLQIGKQVFSASDSGAEI